ncbi:MAG: CSLREA domain-containing protein [Dehalococcoidia bacterium]|nr:CSLREA domain-containing protein [Dehalococcoidia bacterium]
MRWRDRNWRGDRRRELGLALRWALAVGLVALALVLGQPTTALGATFTVNTTADTPDFNPGDGNCADASGACSLRAAIMEANALGGGPHTIVLQAGQTYTLSKDDDDAGHQTDSGADNDDLDIESNITIQGNGATIKLGGGCTQDVYPDDGQFRIFHVHDGASLYLERVNVEEGCADGDDAPHWYGGGIYVEDGGILNITSQTAVSFNTAAYGGGIYNAGRTTISQAGCVKKFV